MKILLIWLAILGHLYAADTRSTLNLYQDILSMLVPKKMIKVYTTNRALQKSFVHSKRLVVVFHPEEADVIIVSSKTEGEKLIAQLDRDKKQKLPVLFGTDYRLLAAYPEVIGALYWRKGRTQLLFVRSRLRSYGIALSKKYQKYSVDAL